MTNSPRSMSAVAAVAVALLLGPFPLRAQTIRVTAEMENLRAEPRGEVIATLPAGTTLDDARRDGEWYSGTLRGWIWAASVESAGRPDRVTVFRGGGENLRSEPNGDVLARVNPNAVLTELERRERWVRVERTAWIWAGSVEPVGAAAVPAAPVPQRPAQTTTTTAPPQARPAARTTVGAGDRQATAGERGAALLQSPEGDTLARVSPMTMMDVVAREGNWARVRLEGWVWQPGLSSVADTGAVLRDVSAAVLGANPENFRGRTIEWRLQFISLERAERIRTDFYEGEPFILARGPGDESAFVYVAVPPERVAQVERLGPLERIVVLARVRTGRSRVMGAPVLDLIELRRE